VIGPGIHSYPWVAFFASFLATQERRELIKPSKQGTLWVRGASQLTLKWFGIFFFACSKKKQERAPVRKL